jgi:hypothetical protein
MSILKKYLKKRTAVDEVDRAKLRKYLLIHDHEQVADLIHTSRTQYTKLESQPNLWSFNYKYEK